jgi:hypothetical protein
MERIKEVVGHGNDDMESTNQEECLLENKSQLNMAKFPNELSSGMAEKELEQNALVGQHIEVSMGPCDGEHAQELVGPCNARNLTGGRNVDHIFLENSSTTNLDGAGLNTEGQGDDVPHSEEDDWLQQSTKKKKKPKKIKGKDKQRDSLQNGKVDSLLSNSIEDSHIRMGNGRFISQTLEKEAEKMWDVGLSLGVSVKGNKREWLNKMVDLEKRDKTEARNIGIRTGGRGPVSFQ